MLMNHIRLKAFPWPCLRCDV